MSKKRKIKAPSKYFVALAVILALILGGMNVYKMGGVNVFAGAESLLAAVGASSSTTAPVLVSSTSVTSVAPGGYAKLRGKGLSTNVTISGATYPIINPKLSDSDQRLDFKIDSREKPGTYSVFVTNAYGKSNSLPFTVKGSAPVTLPVIDVANSVLSVTPGGWAKLRGKNLTTNVTIPGSIYPVLNPSLGDSNQRLDFKVDSREKPGSYSVYVTNAYGKSNSLPFNIPGMIVTRGTPTAVVDSSGIATFVIPFTVTAGDNDVYIKDNAPDKIATTTSPYGSNVGVQYSVGFDMGTISTSYFESMNGYSITDSAGNYYKVNSNVSRNFKLTVVMYNKSTTTLATNRIIMRSINWGSSPTLADKHYITEPNTFVTPYLSWKTSPR